MRTSWHYPDDAGSRDLRIDVLRGIAMVMVVIAHIEIPSIFHLFTLERIGVVSEPEAFIFLSGLVIGLIYPPRIAKEGWNAAARKLFKRSFQLYIVSLSVVIAVYLLHLIPPLQSNVLNTYTDGNTHIIYDLYDNTGGDTLTFIRNILILRSGPGQFNIMGLFVVLMFAAPFVLWALEHKKTVYLVLMSGGLYTFNLLHPTRLTIAQFENAFSLLAWQMLFVVGILAGCHWSRIIAIFNGKYGRPIRIVCIIIFFVFMFYTWNNPWLPIPYNLRLTLIHPDTFTTLYAQFFSRVMLGIGRALNALIVFAVLYMLLTRYWIGINRAAGWFLIPIGQASLYVFVVHLFYVLLMDNIPLFKGHHLWINALGETLVLLAIWLMIRQKFLFRIIPR